MIVLSLISFSVETLPTISDETRKLLYNFEIISVSIFTLEYIARIVCADDKKKFIFSFFGIVDLLAILPFYLATGLDLRSLRSFRLLRLVRILKLARYSMAARRFHRAFIIAKEELALFLFAALIILYLAGGVGIYYFEYPAQPEAFCSVFHSLWWGCSNTNNCWLWRHLSSNSWREDIHFLHINYWFRCGFDSCWNGCIGIIES